MGREAGDARPILRDRQPIAVKVLSRPLARHVAIALILFASAHAAMLIGISRPEKFYFDEVHYVPAARQMLEPVMSPPLLNPMHPPLAKELIALSIGGFGDNPLGWRYAAALFGALAIVAIYACGLALFAREGPAIAAALLTFFDQMVFVQSRIAMLDVFALTFGLFGTAAFIHGFRQGRPQRWFALAGLAFGLSFACKWSGLFPLLAGIAIVAVIRLMQNWRAQFADGVAGDWYRPELWPDLRATHVALCFVVIPLVVYVVTFIPVVGWSPTGLWEAQCRIFNDSVTTNIAGHTYMSAWPTWPFLVRPVWYLFDRIGDDRIEAVVLLGNPVILWCALVALAVCLRDWIVARRADAFLILAFYAGPYLAWAALPRELAFLYYYLPSATVASLALVYALSRGNTPRWLLWAFVAVGAAGFAAMLPISAAEVGTSMQTFNRLMLFQSWI
jgi:dolichyl-phosphate-mannose--protein O-mannosyl transferase